MTCEEKATKFFSNLERVLSKARFSSYKQNNGNDQEALGIYVWNTAICESLYPSFQILEVGFRNAIHSEISKISADNQWLTNEIGFLYPDEISSIQSAKKALGLRMGVYSEDFLVAEMSFGFWTSLLDSRYTTMWHKIIASVFPNMPRTIRTRAEASKAMNTVRRLRNAALHHHSVWHWKDLKDQHAQMQILIGWICSSIAEISKHSDRFPEIHARGHRHYNPLAKTISEYGSLPVK